MCCQKNSSTEDKRKLILKISGKKIPLVPFVHDAFRDVIIAFTENLKGHEGGEIEIHID